MQAIILAAGKSTRTYPLTLTRPKPLLKIANKSILEWNLEALSGFVKEAIIIVGFQKEMIMNAFNGSFNGIKITYVEQREQLGTGHAVSLAKDYIKDKFIVLMGDDIYSRKEIERCLRHEFSVLGKEVDDPEKWGVIITKNGHLKEIIEKPEKSPSKLANTGLYVLNKNIFEAKAKKSQRGEYELVDMVTEFAKKNNVAVETVTDYWLPIGYPWHILEANEFLLSKIKGQNKGEVEKGAVLKGEIVIGQGSIIRSGAYIEGPCIIGKNCKIGPNCYIRPSTTLGDGTKVGNACEVKNTVTYENASIGHLSYIGDSVIGEKANLGAGTITANLRHDDKSIKTLVNENLIDTGRRKLGTIIGDHVHTGIHTSIYPGRKIWPNLSTLPGEIVTKDKVA